jgi:site-specific recombinase XerC
MFEAGRGDMKNQWMKSLRMVLKQHNGSVADKTKRAGDKTIKLREGTLISIFTKLEEGGFALKDVNNLKQKHVEFLAKEWENAGLGPSTLQKYFSILRVFCGWIGKAGMVRESASMVSSPEKTKRIYAAESDKSWETAGVTAEELIQAMREINPRMASIMRLARVFGLRLQEAYMIKPHQADQDKYLMINWGTKGGKRRRSVPILTQEQREAIEEAKEFAETSISSMIPDGVKYQTYRNRTRWHLDKIGMTKNKLGITFHGARHAYANDRFESIAGVASPVRSLGQVDANSPAVEFARLAVAEDTGHARKSISGAYLGSFGQKETSRGK